ncbi:MAG: hypothetical protein RLZZ386_858 [Planctomycetota bacterium]
MLCIGALLLIACETKPTTPLINKVSTPNDPLSKDLPENSSAAKNEARLFPKTTELKVGQSLVVILTTDYGQDLIWRVQNPLPDFLTPNGETTQTTLGLGTGTAETRVFKFSSLKAGKENLSFLLGKRSQPNATPIEVRTTLVTVSSP